MTRPIPSFLFHIPNMGNKVLTAEQLQKRMGTVKEPEAVHVIDAISHKRLGNMHPLMALRKFH